MAEGAGTALLLANSIATGAALVALILAFGPVSGAHFNPAVTVADASQGALTWPDAGAYIAAQVAGAFVGVALADAMFDQPLFAWSHDVRAGGSQVFSEAVATFGLLAVIQACARRRKDAVTDTFAGMRGADVPGFVIAQIVGAACATLLFRWLTPALPAVAEHDVVSHERVRV